MSESSPQEVFITEVGPRDGLQNEKREVSSEAKIAFIDLLSDAGLRQIEITSFVHPKRVPAMADAAFIATSIRRRPGVRYIALTPNLKGYERAVDAGCDTVAVFTAASSGFTQANIGMDVERSLDVFGELTRQAVRDGVSVRGYVSTVFACPYLGATAPEQVKDVVSALLDMGCYEISLGDTTGVGTPADVQRLLDVLVPSFEPSLLALHLHDTWGMATANAAAGLPYGIRRFDGSAGGLGGCPFAPGASGNAPTEDLIYLLEQMGYPTGVDLHSVAHASEVIRQELGQPLRSRARDAVMAKRVQGARDADK